MGFLTIAVGAFVGAFTAFCFNFWLQRKKQREENLTYLRYSASRLVTFTDNLYLFRRPFVEERVKAAEERKKQTAPPRLNEAGKHRVLLERIHNGQYDWPFAIEKLNFIADRDPNVIRLVSMGSYAVETLKNVVISINDLIDAQGANGEKDLIKIIKRLNYQVNTTLYLAEKSIELLGATGWVVFKSDINIEGIDPKLQKPKPGVPERLKKWEDTDWFPKDKDRFATFMEKIRC